MEKIKNKVEKKVSNITAEMATLAEMQKLEGK